VNLAKQAHLGRRRRVGLITCDALPTLHEDERPFLEALPAHGLEPVALPWGPSALTADVDAFVVRTPWDWPRRAAAFDAFLARLPEERTYNAPSLMRACLAKDYLFTLARAGIPIVPSELVEGDGSAARAAILRRGWTRAVVKPMRSATAHRTHVVDRDAVPSLEHDRWLVQPFLPEIVDGELSYVFFEGELSHAVRKIPRPGDFRVQEEHGGQSVPEPIDRALAAQARAALDALPGQRPLYARVDGVVHRGALHVMELEVVEPQLFFALFPEAGERLAAALARRLAP
jgi:glutathione synthase/RimK-type ligase-like ATP-grasp enzyme